MATIFLVRDNRQRSRLQDYKQRAVRVTDGTLNRESVRVIDGTLNRESVRATDGTLNRELGIVRVTDGTLNREFLVE